MTSDRVVPFLLACLLLGLPDVVRAAEPVRVDGSSTVYPITAAIAEEHRRIDPAGAGVAVAFSGTTAGFRRLCAGEIEIAGASRPILAGEMSACRGNGVAYVELPVGFDALTLVVNAANDFAGCLSVADLRRIWAPEAEGKLVRWSQVHSRWPDLPLRLFGAGAESGTFDYFTEAIVGRPRAQRRDYASSEDDEELVRGIAAEPGSLGYLPAAYVAAHAGELKVVAISERTPECVTPSELNVRSGRYRPLSRPLFLYVGAAAAERAEVAEFVGYYLSRVGAVATRIGYVALPQEAYAAASERFRARSTGTVFGGEPQVGLRVRDLLGRELRS